MYVAKNNKNDLDFKISFETILKISYSAKKIKDALIMSLDLRYNKTF